MPSLRSLTRTARLLKAPTGAGGPLDLNPLGSFGGGIPSNAQAAWLAGTPMQAALPREIGDFLQGAFGPLEPIMPQPIDAPADGAEQPDPRRWQFPVGWNLPVGIPGSEGIKVAPFQVMRQYAEHFSIVRSCIRVRRDEVLGLDWDIIPTPDAEKDMRTDTNLREDWLKRQKEAKAWFQRPDPHQYSNYRSWMGALLEEILVTDALSLHLCPSKERGLLGSSLGALELIDGTTIRPLVDMRGGTPVPPNPAFQQYMWGVPRVDLMRVTNWDEAQEMAAAVLPYPASRLLYLPYVQRAWTPYGFSPVEQALIPSAIGFKRQAYLLDYFTEGTMPGAYIVPGPDVATATQRRQIQDSLNAIAGDIGYKFKIVVLPHGSGVIPTKEIKLADGSDNVLTELVMMVFAVYSEELSMVPGGKAQGLGDKGHQSGMDDIRRRNRTRPLVQWLRSAVFDFVLQDICGQMDMQWSWVGLDESEDQQALAGIRSTYVAAGILTRDEVRSDLALPPLSLPMTGTAVVTGGPAGLIPLDPSVQGPVAPAGPTGSPPDSADGDEATPAPPAESAPVAPGSLEHEGEGEGEGEGEAIKAALDELQAAREELRRAQALHPQRR